MTHWTAGGRTIGRTRTTIHASQIQMRENTLVIIYGGSADNTARRRTSQATLERGTLRSRLGDLRLQVDTPSGETELNGGSSVVTVDGEGSSVVSNHSGGSARVRGASGAPVTVRPGFGSTVVRGERPARPRPLPATPQLTADTSRSVIGVVGTGGTLVGEWAEVPNAAYYRVELSSEADGSGLIAAVQAPASIRRFEVHRLPAGTYYLALATIDGTRLESRPSERVPLTVLNFVMRTGKSIVLDDAADGDWSRDGSRLAFVHWRELDAQDIERVRRQLEALPLPDYDDSGRLKNGPHPVLLVFGGYRTLRVIITEVMLKSGPWFDPDTTAPGELRATLKWTNVPVNGDLSRDDVLAGR